MAILEENLIESNAGFDKKLQAGSETLILDLLQQQQYQYPVASAIRELVSNAVDSVREKNQFFNIDAGEAVVSDFYVKREGELYENSRYNPDYYDPKWLSDFDNIQLIYHAKSNSLRDSFHIVDSGVGLGGKRLEGSFMPLFSTKRLNTTQLGKFGIGSKAGLALQTDYYTMISRYNGQEYHFNVYDYKVDSTVPAIDLETGKENPYYLTEIIKGKDGKPLKFHYIPTKERNGVEIILQAKKGLRQDFIHAVNSQLLYLEGITFYIKEDDKMLERQSLCAPIEYEDDVFILPQEDGVHNIYSKPHLILNGICYGYIDFLQLEEEDRIGNIGIKVDPSLVDVNTNRESVRWTEKTRNAINNVFSKAKDIAEKAITDSLNEHDFIEWCIKASAVSGVGSINSVLQRLSNIADFSGIKKIYQKVPSITFEGVNDLLCQYEILEIKAANKFSKKQQKYISSLERNSVTNWASFSLPIMYSPDSTLDYRKDMYLLSTIGSFLKIVPKDAITLNNHFYETFKNSIGKEVLEAMNSEDREELLDKSQKAWYAQQYIINDLVKASKRVSMYTLSLIHISEPTRPY